MQIWESQVISIMDKKKVLFSIGATIVLVGIIVAITVYTVKNREQTNIETGSGGVVEMGISEEKSNIIDFSGYTILVYGDKSDVTDTYLSEVIRGVEAIQSAFEEDKTSGFVLMYPEADTCSVLAYGQRSEIYFTEGVYSDWQGFELIEQVTEFTDLQNELQEHLN